MAEALNCHLSDFLCGWGRGKARPSGLQREQGSRCWGIFPSRGWEGTTQSARKPVRCGGFCTGHGLLIGSDCF